MGAMNSLATLELTLAIVACIAILCHRMRSRSGFRTVRDSSVATVAVGLFELLYIYKLSGLLADPVTGAQLAARHPVTVVILEISAPALASAVAWSALRWRSLPIFLALWFAGAALTFATLALVAPSFLRGAAEAAGWLRPASAYHLSGVYEYSLDRQLAVVFAVPLAGLFFLRCATRETRIDGRSIKV
jgi:hypothetical protein